MGGSDRGLSVSWEGVTGGLVFHWREWQGA